MSVINDRSESPSGQPVQRDYPSQIINIQFWGGENNRGLVSVEAGDGVHLLDANLLPESVIQNPQKHMVLVCRFSPHSKLVVFREIPA